VWSSGSRLRSPETSPRHGRRRPAASRSTGRCPPTGGCSTSRARQDRTTWPSWATRARSGRSSTAWPRQEPRTSSASPSASTATRAPSPAPARCSRARPREPDPIRRPGGGAGALAEQRGAVVTVREELVEERAADVRAELLVEEVLEGEGALPLVTRVERRVRLQPLERCDDARRVDDRLAVELE